MSVCQECLMQIRQSRRDCASVAAASYGEHAHFVPEQFRVDMM
jgi:hypothetical protein